jgi:hypothetical protein
MTILLGDYQKRPQFLRPGAEFRHLGIDAPLVASGWTCEHGSGDDCRELFLHPVEVIANSQRWPRHICPDIASTASIRWAIERAHTVIGRNASEGAFVADFWVSRAIHSYLPIGTTSIAQDPRLKLDKWSREQFQRFAVFDGEASLLFPLVARFGVVIVHACFLVAIQTNEDEGDVWESAGIRFRVEGEASAKLPPLVDNFITSATAMWKEFGGTKFGPGRGRPKGTGKTLDYEFACRVRQQMIDEDEEGSDWIYKNRAPYHTEFLDFLRANHGLDLSDDTFRKIRKTSPDWIGKPW